VKSAAASKQSSNKYYSTFTYPIVATTITTAMPAAAIFHWNNFFNLKS